MIDYSKHPILSDGKWHRVEIFSCGGAWVIWIDGVMQEEG